MPTPRTKNGQFQRKAVNGKKLDERTRDQTGQGNPNNGIAPSNYPSGIQGSNAFENGFGFGTSILPAIGGSWTNPFGFPGYGNRNFWGTYANYRWMLQLPPVAFVRSIRNGPILASTWEALLSRKTADGKVPESMKPILDACQNMLDRLRLRLMHDFFVRGNDMGWQGGEPVWELIDGRYEIVRVKPLLQEATEFLLDKNGNFIGLRNNVTVGDEKPPKLSAPFKAFKYTYDGEAGNHYGRSWLENCRATAVKDWLDCMQQLQRLGGKISGVVTVVMAPVGSFPAGTDASGAVKHVTYKDAAQSVIQALARGAAGVYMPNMTIAADARGGMDMVQFMKALYGKSLVTVDVKDFSGTASGIEPILNRLKHAEELIFNGGLRSSRTGLESQHGSRADSQEHTDVGTVNAEVEDEDFADQIQPLLDAYLVANWGDRMKGAVKCHAPSLVDRKTSIYRAVLMAVLNEPTVRRAYSKSLGFTAMNKTLDIPQEKELNKGEIVDDKAAPPDPKGGSSPEPEGGRPTK